MKLSPRIASLVLAGWTQFLQSLQESFRGWLAQGAPVLVPIANRGVYEKAFLCGEPEAMEIAVVQQAPSNTERPNNKCEKRWLFSNRFNPILASNPTQ